MQRIVTQAKIKKSREFAEQNIEMKIQSVRIRNFRALKDVTIPSPTHLAEDSFFLPEVHGSFMQKTSDFEIDAGVL